MAKMKSAISLLSLAMVIVLGVVDYASGYEFSFSVFYLLPIIYCCWYGNEISGVIISLVSAFFWYEADLLSGHVYSHPAFPVWNAFMRFMVFLIIVRFVGLLRNSIDHEKKISRSDALTGLYNMKALAERYESEKNRASRFKKVFSLAFIDLDNFKLVNDNFGHAKGDEVLAEIGRVIRSSIRNYDIPARAGGDEFVILFPETDFQQAHLAMDKLNLRLKGILEKRFAFLSLSAGVVTIASYGRSLEEVISFADKLMYSVKNNSKNGIAYSLIN